MLVMGASCQDFLDRHPLNQVSTQIFWSDEKDVIAGLAGVYSRLQSNFLGYERVYLDGLSDNAFLPANTNQNNMVQMTTGSISPVLGGAMVNMYSTPYRAITSCNYFLANVGKAGLTAEKENRYSAEVRFIRALAYFDLVQSFGDVIIYRKYFSTVNDSKIAKSPKEDVYEFIEEDLKFAIEHLPDVKFSGHAVKGSAQALLARVLITQEKWSQAIPHLEALMDSHYSLSNNYAALFTSAGQARPEVNREIIFAVQYLAPNNPQRVSPGAAGMNIELGWWSLMQPYQDLVNSYEMIDGNLPSESPLYDANNPYANRDPRLDLTVKLPGEAWVNPNTGTVWDQSHDTFTGFIMEKYVELAKAPFNPAVAQQTDQNYIHLRYADVLLMYAEAKNEVSGPDASVYAALNEVRGREGINMPPVDQAKYNTQQTLRELIRRERRVELALEGQRYNDLKRWKIAHIKLPTMTNANGDQMVFEMRHYHLPLPFSEMDNNPQLEQNPNY